MQEVRMAKIKQQEKRGRTWNSTLRGFAMLSHSQCKYNPLLNAVRKEK
jgi:hypothetical protein